jgi:magnesium transporter
MFTAIHKKEDRLARVTKLDKLATLSPESIVWIDLYNANESERKQVEQLLEINLENAEYALERDKFLKFIETKDELILQSHFILPDTEKETEYCEYTASQVLKSNTLISIRTNELKSFIETRKRIDANPRFFADGYNVLITIFEVRIDLNANILMDLSKEVEVLGHNIIRQRNPNEKPLLEIAGMQEKTMLIRENLIEYQRLLSVMLRSERFSPSLHDRIRILLKEISSLMQQIDFIFERLSYLQNTLLGLINLAQSNIIKIFTVVSILFMPPTMIAGIYGMNFDAMPELKWRWGYPLALLLMLVASSIILVIFRRKKWL